MKNAYTILIGKPEGQAPIGRYTRIYKLDYNITVDLDGARGSVIN
jgi:hypothetical protein